MTVSAAPPVLACIANPNPIQETQPDGTAITLKFRGDKFFHWYEDAAGYTVLRRADGTYVHATQDIAGNLVPTESRVGLDDPAANALVPGIMPSEAARAEKAAKAFGRPPEAAKSTPSRVPPTGTVKNLVIMARFSDHGARTLPSNANINTLFNAVGGDPTYAPTGSVKDVYTQNSYGQMTLQSTVVGWVTLPNTEAYYADGTSGGTTKMHDMIRHALAAADSQIDFNQFDTDADGYVDSIAFIHSGYGAEWGGTDAYGATEEDRIWSHRWELWSGEYVSAEGERVYDYHISPGVWGTSGSAIGRIGVIAHETGHFFGLPDLYDTDYSARGIGAWCMMADSWGFMGDQYRPPHFSAWCKVELGWVTPTTQTVGGTYNITSVETTPTIHKLTTGFPSGEYLLVENRFKTGYDADMPTSGLAVWHIDETVADNDTEGYPGQAGWPGNGNHYKVALLQADGAYHLEKNTNGGDAGDLFRSGGVTTIGPSTVPSTDRYQGGTVADTNITLSSISAGGSTMSYTLTLPGGPAAPEIAVADGATNIPDGGGPINFGSVAQGGTALSKTFTVSNTGTAALTTSTPTLPAGYSITEALSASIGAGASDSFTVALSTATQGTFAGSISFANNDADENPFNFSVTGTIAAPGGNNNTCANATPIADGQTVTGTTVGATVDGSTTCGSSGSSPDVWYSYQATCNGSAIATTCGSSYDTVLSVHSACGSGTTIICDDDDDSGACGTNSVVSFNAVAGTTYLFRVSGYNGSTGSYSLNLDVDCDIQAPQVGIVESEVTIECAPAKMAAAPEEPFRNPGPDILPARASKFANEAEIEDMLAKSVDGNVEVVVTLQQPWATLAKTDWRDPASVAELHADAAALRETAIAAVDAREISVKRRFENIAGFAAVVTREGLAALEKNELVYAIEPSFPIEAHMAQGIPQMGATAARATFTGNGLAVAICDTGIDYDHPRLGDGGFPNGKVLGGYDFGDNDSNPDSGGNAHGTSCAGIAAGATGTVGDYIGGVAPDAKLYALKMSAGNTGSATSEAMIASWDWCVTHWNDNPSYPIKVISTSFGGGRFTATCDGDSPAMTLAAANAAALGITVLASSGNDGYCDSTAWPSCIASVISVGAVYDGATGNGGWCVNSGSCHPNRQANGGCSTGWVVFEDGALDKVTAYSNAASFLDILAPSNNAYTTDLVGAPGYTAGDYTTNFGGTSAACPYAAGAVALLQSASMAITGSWMTPVEVRSLLTTTGNPILDTKTPITKPRVNVANALATFGEIGPIGTFTIVNNGEGDLTVTGLADSKGAEWMEFLAPLPITVLAGSSQTVPVRIDCEAAPAGETTVTLTTDSDATNGEDSVTIRIINGPDAVDPVGDALSIH